MSVIIDGTNSSTFPADASISGLTVGKGGGSVSTNTAVGASAMTATNTGGYNTAVGNGALTATTAGGNVGVGYNALTTNSTGLNNTALGTQALNTNSSGAYNTSVGLQSLYSNTTASNNTAVGYQAGYSGTTAANNTFIGNSVGKNVTTGSGNVMLGALNSSGTYSPLYDVTTGNDRVAIGTTSTTNAYVQVSWTVISDARDKTNVSDLNIGLDFVNKLHPVKYKFKKSRQDETPHGNLRYGFLAQEILELEGNEPVIIDNEDSEKLRYTGEALIPVLVKSIQELKTIVDAQAAEIAALKPKA
jgi:hypothetical protein